MFQYSIRKISFRSGGSGSKTFESEKVIPAGSNRYYGVNGVWVTTNVFWKQVRWSVPLGIIVGNSTVNLFRWQIPHSSFSLCVVLTKGDQESSMPRLNPQRDEDFLYHRLDLVPPKTPCRHFNNYAAMGESEYSNILYTIFKIYNTDIMI